MPRLEGDKIEDWEQQLSLLQTNYYVGQTVEIFAGNLLKNMSLETSDSLRQQFQLIQEQQQKKLLARKQRKAKSNEKTGQEDASSTTDTFWGHDGQTDNLDLKVCKIYVYVLFFFYIIYIKTLYF